MVMNFQAGCCSALRQVKTVEIDRRSPAGTWKIIRLDVCSGGLIPGSGQLVSFRDWEDEVPPTPQQLMLTLGV